MTSIQNGCRPPSVDVISLTEGKLQKQLREMSVAKAESIGSNCPERHTPARPRKLAEWHRSSPGFWDLEPGENPTEALAMPQLEVPCRMICTKPEAKRDAFTKTKPLIDNGGSHKPQNIATVHPPPLYPRYRFAKPGLPRPRLRLDSLQCCVEYLTTDLASRDKQPHCEVTLTRTASRSLSHSTSGLASSRC